MKNKLLENFVSLGHVNFFIKTKGEKLVGMLSL